MDRYRSDLQPSRLGKRLILAIAAIVIAMLLGWWPADLWSRVISLLCIVAISGETSRLLRRAAALSGTLRLLEHGELHWSGTRWLPQGKPLMFSWGLFWRLRSEQGRRRGLWLMRDSVSESEWRRWRREMHQ